MSEVDKYKLCLEQREYPGDCDPCPYKLECDGYMFLLQMKKLRKRRHLRYFLICAGCVILFAIFMAISTSSYLLDNKNDKIDEGIQFIEQMYEHKTEK